MVKPRAGGKAGKEKHESSVKGADIAERPDQELARHIFDQIREGGTPHNDNTHDECKLRNSITHIVDILRKDIPTTFGKALSEEGRLTVHALEMMEALIYGLSHPICNPAILSHRR